MDRILKRHGRLAILRNYPTDDERNDALAEIVNNVLGAGLSNIYPSNRKKPIEIYFGKSRYQKLTFGFEYTQNWREFIGVLSTVSYMPDVDDPQFAELESEARNYFTHHSQDEYLIGHGETELLIGQPSW